MFVKACKTYHDGGAPMLRHDLAFKNPTELGWLVSRYELGKRTGRQVKRAWLLDKSRTKNVFPPLYYVDIDLGNGSLHVRGEERDSLSGKLTAMAWYCELVDHRRHGQDSRGPLPV